MQTLGIVEYFGSPEKAESPCTPLDGPATIVSGAAANRSRDAHFGVPNLSGGLIVALVILVLENVNWS